jgi:hypothetical protein
VDMGGWGYIGGGGGGAVKGGIQQQGVT